MLQKGAELLHLEFSQPKNNKMASAKSKQLKKDWKYKMQWFNRSIDSQHSSDLVIPIVHLESAIQKFIHGRFYKSSKLQLKANARQIHHWKQFTKNSNTSSIANLQGKVSCQIWENESISYAKAYFFERGMFQNEFAVASNGGGFQPDAHLLWREE